MSAENQAVAVPTKETALQVYQVENGLDPYLAKIREEIDGFIPDVKTKKGRDAIASIAYKVAQSKTALDNVGKNLVAELKDVPKKIDAERKRMRDLLDNWKDEVRKPLTEWEEAEATRVAHHQQGIDQIKLRLECRDLSVEELKENIDWLEGLSIGEHWQEFEAEAGRAKTAALAALRDALVIREKHEAELAAIAKFQAEQAAREQKEREERIAREAVETERVAAQKKAQAEREEAAKREADAKAASERRELELKLQAEQAERAAAEAERNRIEAEAKAERERAAAERKAIQDREDAERRQAEAVERAAQQERQRAADAQAEEERQAKARESDRKHKASVMGAAKEAIMAAGVSEELGREIVKLIVAGKVPRTTISF